MTSKTALATLFETAPEQALALTGEQVVKLCGNGRLIDDSESSNELRAFLGLIPSDSLSAYASGCLSHTFEAGGLLLQDIVNELGRRLDYSVENGLYKGRVNRIGYDGIWKDSDSSLVVEVKTTDSYRINLDRIEHYRSRLIAERHVLERSSILIVVGREDTGDLEAQVRGSRHAWSIRLISVEALSKLVAIKERTEEPTTRKIHELLTPFEYTKLDAIIDVVFDVAEDATAAVDNDAPAATDLDHDVDETAGRAQSPTPREEIEKIRLEIAATLGLKYRPVIKKSGVQYWSTDRELRAVIAYQSTMSSEAGPTGINIVHSGMLS